MNANANGKTYKPEQETGAKKIILAAKSSHYEALGVPRSADDDQIKKAYRKLALKFHPDKNSAPSSEKAFKALNQAMEVLGDPDKRSHYDAYGSDEPNQGMGGGGDIFQNMRRGGGGGGGHHGSPEDIFNMFFNQGGFGGGQRGGGAFRTYTFNTGGGGRQQQQEGGQGGQQQQQRGGVWSLINMLPVLLMIFMTMGGGFNLGGKSASPYTLQKGVASYPVPRTATTLGERYPIQYFVDDKFHTTYKGQDLKKIEKSVQSEYKYFLDHMCDREREAKRNKVQQVTRAGRGRAMGTEQKLLYLLCCVVLIRLSMYFVYQGSMVAKRRPHSRSEAFINRIMR